MNRRQFNRSLAMAVPALLVPKFLAGETEYKCPIDLYFTGWKQPMDSTALAGQILWMGKFQTASGEQQQFFYMNALADSGDAKWKLETKRKMTELRAKEMMRKVEQEKSFDSIAFVPDFQDEHGGHSVITKVPFKSVQWVSWPTPPQRNYA